MICKFLCKGISISMETLFIEMPPSIQPLLTQTCQVEHPCVTIYIRHKLTQRQSITYCDTHRVQTSYTQGFHHQQRLYFLCSQVNRQTGSWVLYSRISRVVVIHHVISLLWDFCIWIFWYNLPGSYWHVYHMIKKRSLWHMYNTNAITLSVGYFISRHCFLFHQFWRKWLGQFLKNKWIFPNIVSYSLQLIVFSMQGFSPMLTAHPLVYVLGFF